MKKVLGVIVFFIIWAAGCAIQGEVLQIEDSSWLMCYGYLVGAISIGVMEHIHSATVNPNKGRRNG